MCAFSCAVMINLISVLIKEERNTLHKIKRSEGQLDWPHPAYDLPSDTCYCRKNRSSGKARTEKLVTTG